MSTRERLLDRRDALRTGVAACAGLASAPGMLWPKARLAVSPPLAAPEGTRSLVLIQLTGGNDGLSTLVPYADDDYGRARSASRIEASEVLRLDDYCGFHPDLHALRKLYGEGQLALLPAVGYPGPVRSHSKSLDVWHAASERGRTVGQGWIGRLCGGAWRKEASPTLMVHFGAEVPFALYSEDRAAIAFESPDEYGWTASASQAQALDGSCAEGAADPASELAHLREVLRDARASADAVVDACKSYRSDAPYLGAIGLALRTTAALASAGSGCRVYSIEVPGFDTHSLQRYRLDRLYGPCDDALGVFVEDLRERTAGKDLVFMIYSEFGRHLEENAGRGTEHGAAGLVLIGGQGVRGGIYGGHPSLSESDLDHGDPAYRVDLRSVYATLLERWFGIEHGPVLGGKWPLLDFV